ncbi:MAG: YARHG domain-containing protein [Clostridia bacterium]|nr:YARHG domain-containing protein [Clostridia bacterium]MBR2287320.1 YARHG domain-containing protein [Clostridia bacterium]
MKRIAILLVAIIALMCSTSFAEKAYLIADSDSRELTAQELWNYNLECVNFIYDEILARHGYVFKPGEKFDNWFRLFGWYTPNENPDNQVACYPLVSNLEWRNIRTCKDVINDMIAQGTTNPGGLSKEEVITGQKGVSPQAFDVLQGFQYVSIPSGQLLPVYWGPSENTMRGLDGRAAVSTNGNIYAAGWENGFLLIMYEADQGNYAGSVHVGYVHNMNGAPNMEKLSFAYTKARLTKSVQLTDDPARTFVTIGNLAEGTEVTYLSTFYNRYAWDYIEADVRGMTVRGFIESGCLDTTGVDMPEVDAYLPKALTIQQIGAKAIAAVENVDAWKIELIQASDNQIPDGIVIEKITNAQEVIGFASSACYRVTAPVGYEILYSAKDGETEITQDASEFFIFANTGNDRLILKKGDRRYVFSLSR